MSEPFEMLTDNDLREMYEKYKAMAGEVEKLGNLAANYEHEMKMAVAERDKWQGKSNDQEDRADLLTAERDRLKAALAPFAEILSLLDDPSVAQLGDEFETSFTAPDDYIVQAHPVPCHDMETSSDYVTICTVGDLRKARKALVGDA